MASNFETGNAKNIANLDVLNTNIIALGAVYNPSNPTLALPKLQRIYILCNQYQSEVNSLQGPYSLAVDAREAVFKPLNKELTKLGKAYKITQGVTAAQYEDFKTIARKLKGERKDKTEVPAKPEDESTSHSVSQMSYDQRTNNLGILISLLENTTNYNPNEEEYKVETYKVKKVRMLALTKDVSEKFVPFNSARSNRNQVVYTNEDNLVKVANDAKEYIATILDTSSLQYKAIARITFRKK